jgi:hypothetical protein
VSGHRSYPIDWSDEAKANVQSIPVFERAAVIAAVDDLAHQAEIETRNRKPLRRALEDLPEAVWEVRVAGKYRVLYRVTPEQTVRILRVILKGTLPLEVALGRSMKR